MGMTPEIEHDGEKWKFMGIYAKNREEWMVTTLANMKNSVVTVAFYDTLGPQAVEFVIRQTQLTSISCAGQYVAGLIKLKKDGKADSLKNIISFEPVTEDQKNAGAEVGIDVHYFHDIIDKIATGLNKPDASEL